MLTAVAWRQPIIFKFIFSQRVGVEKKWNVKQPVFPSLPIPRANRKRFVCCRTEHRPITQPPNLYVHSINITWLKWAYVQVRKFPFSQKKNWTDKKCSNYFLKLIWGSFVTNETSEKISIKITFSSQNFSVERNFFTRMMWKKKENFLE